MPTVEAKLFEGFTDDDIEWIGGESHITETVGLGGFAQAAAFALQAYQGGVARGDDRRPTWRCTRSPSASTPSIKIPYFGFRGHARPGSTSSRWWPPGSCR